MKLPQQTIKDEITMTQIVNNTESRKGKHLSYKERALIEYWFNIQQWSRREIAKELGKAPQTINQEIKDGTVQQKRIYNGQELDFEIYSAEAGQVKYDYARENCGRCPKWLDDQKFVDCADKMMLEYDFSPDSVVGRANLEGEIPKHLILQPQRSTIGLIKDSCRQSTWTYR
ncbi:MAG: helix-turn-helix domain-containing protein [Lactobacillales bacterium]|nr:helix-turn-helix domain-containing protein [Lactobacillales bacterium]